MPCFGGVCVGSDPIICDEHVGDVCFDPGTCVEGICEYPINETKDCDDQDAYLNDKCQSDGSCYGNTPRTCSENRNR